MITSVLTYDFDGFNDSDGTKPKICGPHVVWHLIKIRETYARTILALLYDEE